MPPASIIDTRREQMFPVLAPAEVERLRRFGELRRHKAGEFVVRAGQPSEGLMLVLSGHIRMAPHGHPDATIVTHGPGEFQGELAQLSGRPSLVDGLAVDDVEVVLIPPARLRDLMIAEAELGERIMRALILRRVRLLEQHVGGPIIIGRAGNRDVLRLENFLRRNGHPDQFLDSGTDDCAKTLIERFHVAPADLPTVLCPNGTMLRNPTENQLARCIGLSRAIDASTVYDVAVVGAGPAGLATAVYATSEGLSVVVLDCRAFGGQAGASARIENYLGFPTGISGIALMARAYNQAQKFGAEIAIPEETVSLACEDTFLLRLKSGDMVRARSIVIASGAEYRRLGVANLAEFEGSHVHYWASPLEARLCAGEEVALVGAGNSAGQAAVYLADRVEKVWMIVRGKNLGATMSRYLCDRIAAQPNIEVLTHTEVTALEGANGALERVRWKNHETGEETVRFIRHVFLFIGAAPNTKWLTQSGIAVDGKGFVCAEGFAGDGRYPFQTNRAGIFAVGDVRSGSVKRVAAAVGEGSQVVATLHAWLAASRTDAVPVAHG
ncbi:MAG TPA: FAD-dependent oxidoreductase [Rhizomicrobium sp.]|jgi:thioredoxin reductase (NADPH)|nr:FAD-dependent oxidoreductase [Rhizomicrobium sp.]